MKATTKTNRPAPPEEIEGTEALREWQRVCDELDAAGRLDKADRAVLTLYVQTWQTWRVATQGVVKHGPVTKYSNKMVGPSPYFTVAKETAKQLRGLLNDMGLTPTARDQGKAEDDGGDLDL